MNVSDEGYSNLLTMNVSDEGYSNIFDATDANDTGL
jgi:hypothetical protein